MRSHIEAMRALAYTNAMGASTSPSTAPTTTIAPAADELADLLTPITKAWCTDLGSELTRLATQVHGGMGYIGETGVEQHERDIRIAAIYEGTNGIQAMDLVGRKLAAARRRRRHRPDRRHRGDRRRSRRRSRRPGAAPRRRRRARCARRPTGCSPTAPQDPQNALAGATPYLRLFGTVLGGWFLARQAIAARAAGSDDFHAAKVATARYYLEQVLPTARGLVPSVIAGPDTLLALTPNQLQSS